MTKDVVFEIIAREQKCSIDDLTLGTHLQHLGIDSLKAITILYQLEERFEIEIPNELIEQIVTIGDIVTNIDRLRENSDTQCHDT
jgi:acyl carrier protein